MGLMVIKKVVIKAIFVAIIMVILGWLFKLHVYEHLDDDGAHVIDLKLLKVELIMSIIQGYFLK
jgi:hypothetical protein